jgi:hypothetical protein
LRPSICAALVAFSPAAMASVERTEAEPRPNALLVFGGWATAENWDDIVVAPHEIEFADSQLLGVAYSREVWRPFESLSFEVEAQAVKHLGDQTHWEFNLPLGVARWRPLEAVDASVAFALGLSLATETPALEVELEGDSQAVMTYWAIEVETATALEDVRLVGRIHHRSTAYGVFGEDGGLNSLVIGLRKKW